MTVVGGDLGRCTCELKVLPEHANVSGSLHGGYIATLIDSTSTSALLSVNENVPGVSIDMNIRYEMLSSLP